MKRKIDKKRAMISVLLIMILIFSITGCQSKGLLTYQQALDTTYSIDKGEVKIEIGVMLDFDKTGLSFEEEKILSDFEELSGSITAKYDMSKELIETNLYYIQGGMGIDSSIFVKDNQLILQLPIINLYMILSEEDMFTLEANNNNLGDQQASYAGISLDMDKVLDNWISVFEEDNVVVGNNTYVLTNEGQLKTTKYSFNLDNIQLKTLEDLLFSEIDMNNLNTLIVSQIKEYSNSDEVIDFNIEKILEKIQLNILEGEAFVDFDNRLIRQNFILKGEGIDVKPGDLDSFEIKLSMTFTKLGDEQDFDFPTLTDENVVDQEELNKIFDTFMN